MKRCIRLAALKISQPIGDFFVAKISARELVDISWVDVRRMDNEEGEIDRYIGIQRRISSARVEKLREYVRSADATFPTSIVVAVPDDCAQYDESSGILELSEYVDPENPSNSVSYENIAKILDGQHRIRAFASPNGQGFLFDFDKSTAFEMCVTFFVGADLPTQATIFSIVNLAQTKVNKSLVYDLYSLAKTRSPQKSAHFIAVALDERPTSPFYRSIKRLGAATPGREPGSETITQATFVEALVPYLSDDAMKDRDFYLLDPDGTPPRLWMKNGSPAIFRDCFLNRDEGSIAKILWSYFEAVSTRWPRSWSDNGKGVILKRTNGFRALMAVLGEYYLRALGNGQVGTYVPPDEFLRILRDVKIEDGDFTSERFAPGSSGEAALKREFRVALTK